MMNPIGIRNEDRISSRDPWLGGRTAVAWVPGPGARWSGPERYEGSEVGMVGMAERYWKELRPSSAGRFRLDAAIRDDRGHSVRNPRRPRRHPHPKLRTASR